MFIFGYKQLDLIQVWCFRCNNGGNSDSIRSMEEKLRLLFTSDRSLFWIPLSCRCRCLHRLRRSFCLPLPVWVRYPFPTWYLYVNKLYVCEYSYVFVYAIVAGLYWGAIRLILDFLGWVGLGWVDFILFELMWFKVMGCWYVSC